MCWLQSSHLGSFLGVMGKKHKTRPGMMRTGKIFLLTQRRKSTVCWIHKGYGRLLVCQAGLEEKGPCCKDIVGQKRCMFSNGCILPLSLKRIWVFRQKTVFQVYVLIKYHLFQALLVFFGVFTLKKRCRQICLKALACLNSSHSIKVKKCYSWWNILGHL